MPAPLALLAQLDRTLWTWSHLSAGRLRLLGAARIAAESRLRGPSASATEWKAERSPTIELRGGPSVMLTRDRIGVEYSTRHTIGGEAPRFEDEQTAALALVDHVLRGPEGEAAARALIDLVTVYEKGAKNGRKAIRRLGKMQAPASLPGAPS